MALNNLMEIAGVIDTDATPSFDDQVIDLEGDFADAPEAGGGFMASLAAMAKQKPLTPAEESGSMGGDSMISDVSQQLTAKLDAKFADPDATTTVRDIEDSYYSDPETRPGLGMIKDFEKLKLKGYFATDHEREKGIVSVGYGSTGLVGEGEEITEEQANSLLYDEYERLDNWLYSNVTAKLTDPQRGALVSLIYNVGTGAFKRSKAFKALNSGDMETFLREAFDEKVGFVYQNKKRLNGLVKRRNMERELFLSGMPKTEEAAAQKGSGITVEINDGEENQP